MTLNLEWHGPYVLAPKEGIECVFDLGLASKPGICLWTIEHEGGYLINYVDQTKRSFSKRLGEYVQWSFGGMERILDPDQFEQGKIVVELPRPSIKEFLANYPKFSSANFRVYSCFRMFLAPTAFDNETRKLIEAGIIRTLRNCEGYIADFLANCRLMKPAGFEVLMKSPLGVRFHGLGEVIEC